MLNRRHFCQTALAGATAALLPVNLLLASPMNKVIADVDAISLTGKQMTLRQLAVQELSDSLRGPLILPGNEAYDLARQVLNPSIDKHPALIVQPTGAADVSRAVQFASDNNLVVAVKCGGHSSAGKSTCDGGLMIDLSRFRHVRVDKNAQVAHVSGGSLLGEMDHETMRHGLVTVAGTVSHTGVGGLTTGGGFGRLARRFGLTLDNVKAVDVVSADGQLRHASADENQDLYWGVRGGGGNFGVVTSFELNLHKMDRRVMAGSFVYPMSRFKDVAAFYAEFSARAPRELQVDLIAGFRPGDERGFVVLAVCYTGLPNNAERVLASIKTLGKPMAGGVKRVDYVALQRMNDNSAPRSTATYLKGGFVSQITPALITALDEALQPHPERSVQFLFQQAGGAISEVPTQATAFSHRYAQYNMIFTLGWKPQASAEQHVQAIKRDWNTLLPFTEGFYVNEADDDNAALVNKNYRENFARLLDVKKQYDPNNIFRLNANIRS